MNNNYLGYMEMVKNIQEEIAENKEKILELQEKIRNLSDDKQKSKAKSGLLKIFSKDTLTLISETNGEIVLLNNRIKDLEDELTNGQVLKEAVDSAIKEEEKMCIERKKASEEIIAIRNDMQKKIDEKMAMINKKEKEIEDMWNELYISSKDALISKGLKEDGFTEGMYWPYKRKEILRNYTK